MSILDKVVQLTAIKAAEKVSKTAVNSAINSSERALLHYIDKNSESALMNNGTQNPKLLVKKKALSFSRNFYVLNEKNEKVYTVEAGIMKKHMILKDVLGNEVGKIERTKDDNFKLSVQGQVLGQVNWLPSLKGKFKVDFNGWYIKGKPFKWLFNVYNSCDTIIMQIHEPISSNDSYIVEFANSDDIVIGLLVVLSIDLFMNKN